MPRTATSGSRATRRREDLAHLVDRHWVVAWNLDEPFTQEIVTHPSFHMVFEPDADLIYGVVTQRFRRQLRREGIAVATKFRPGGFHPFHPVPAHTLTDRTIPVSDVFAPMAIAGDERAADRRDGGGDAGARRRRTTRASPRSRELYAAMLARADDASRSCARTPATPSARCSGCSASTWA